jgi:peptidoglycan/LPS O-acetylase OafA/YrhL
VSIAAVPSPGAPIAAPARTLGGYLHEVDLLRLLTFASVIGVHVLGFTVPTSSVAWYGVDMLLHFTRQVFFALTGFVLVYGFLRKPRPMSIFWPRRFLLVGVPYVTWSAVYVLVGWLASDTSRGNVATLISRFSADVLTGNAKYHLYFLMVTMQVYLIAPGLVWVARRTLRTQFIVLGLAFLLQVAILTEYMYVPGSFGAFRSGVEELFPTYLFAILAGTVAAAHSDAFLRWIRSSRRTVAWVVVAGAALSLAVYFVHLGIGRSPSSASAEMQPVESVWSVVAGLGLITLGASWADRRRPHSRSSRFIAWASDRSFGIYLVHPLVIYLVLLGPWFDRVVPAPARFPVLYVIVAGGATLISDLLRRTPVSMPFTGRPFARKKHAS